MAQKIKAFLLERVSRQWIDDPTPCWTVALVTWRILRPVLKHV